MFEPRTPASSASSRRSSTAPPRVAERRRTSRRPPTVSGRRGDPWRTRSGRTRRARSRASSIPLSAHRRRGVGSLNALAASQGGDHLDELEDADRLVDGELESGAQDARAMLGAGGGGERRGRGRSPPPLPPRAHPPHPPAVAPLP